MFRLSLLLMLFATPSFADHIELTMNGSKVPIMNATITLQAGPTGELTIVAINGGSSPVIPGPITPGPIIPAPTTDLASTIKKATDAVTYATKDEDARSIAFNLNFVTPYLTGNAKASDITAVLKTMSDAGIGANAGQWTAWWATFDASTKNMTMDQYKVALGVAVNSLTASSDFQSGEFMGVENFGLDLTKLMQLLEFIMKFLPIILALFQ